MATILPVPAGLIFLHGIFKVVYAGVLAVLLVLLLRKYSARRTRIARAFLILLACMIPASLLSSFDNMLGWDNLLGEGTWFGFGTGHVLNTVANVGYFWLYIEIFHVDITRRWNTRQVLIFSLVSLVLVTCSFLIMFHYLLGFLADITIVSILYMVVVAVIYVGWVSGCTRQLQATSEERYRQKFKYLLYMAIIFFAAMVINVITALGDEPSILSWIGLVIQATGIYFAYKSIVHEAHHD